MYAQTPARARMQMTLWVIAHDDRAKTACSFTLNLECTAYSEVVLVRITKRSRHYMERKNLVSESCWGFCDRERFGHHSEKASRVPAVTRAGSEWI